MDTTLIPIISLVITAVSLIVAIMNMRRSSRNDHDKIVESQKEVSVKLDNIDRRLTRVENKIDVATPLPKGNGGKD